MRLEHVASLPVSPLVPGPIDGKLAELGLYRNIRVIVPEFNIVPYVIMSSDLVFTTGTNRMAGRPTASQIASASLRSFLFDFTYGFTN